MAIRHFTSSLALLLVTASCAHGCVYLMGQSLDSVVAPSSATPWFYGFRGDDWEKGVDSSGKPWQCQSGTSQSPINILKSGDRKHSSCQLRTAWYYEPATSDGKNIQVFNNGHTIQVQWTPGTVESSVLINTAGNTITDLATLKTPPKKVKTVSATPLQFHFHTDSEHTIDGTYYPMEMHIVHSVPKSELPGCPETGCLTVTGIMFKLDPEDKDNPALEELWSVMPEREGVVANLPAGKVLDIQALLPKDKQYALYSGSLTTPPCTEGLLWHVFTTPVTMSLNQLRRYQRAVGLKECTEKEGAKTRRALRGLDSHAHSHDHTHNHSAEPVNPGFVRGSYTGFISADALQSRPRGLLAAGSTNPDAYTCTIKSYGFTNRNVQPLHGRRVSMY